jgi:hypothetical protein
MNPSKLKFMSLQKFSWLIVLLLVGCATAVSENQPVVKTPFDEITSLAVPTQAATSTEPAPEAIAINKRVETEETYSISALIPFDGIRPIYDPIFVRANDAPYDDDELVMGVAWGGEAKAYSVTVLRFREMVNDELAGVPTLVTW